jgi:hypothetical protein
MKNEQGTEWIDMGALAGAIVAGPIGSVAGA